MFLLNYSNKMCSNIYFTIGASFLTFFSLSSAIHYAFNKIKLIKKDNNLYTAYIVSFFHSLITATISLYECYKILSLNVDIFNYSSNLILITSGISIGYFIQDTTYLLQCMREKISRDNLMYLMHHVVFSISIYMLAMSNKYHALIVVGLLTEITTIFVDLHMLFRFLAKYYNGVVKNYENVKNKVRSVYYDNLSQRMFNIFAVLFGVIRICMLSVIFVLHRHTMYNISIYLYSVGIFIVVLNFVWFVGITKAVRNYRKVNA